MKDPIEKARTEAAGKIEFLKKLIWLVVCFTGLAYFGLPGCSTVPKRLSPEKLQKVLTDPLNLETNRDPKKWGLPNNVESYADASLYTIYTNKGDHDVLIFCKKADNYELVPRTLLQNADRYGLKEEQLIEVPKEDLNSIISTYLKKYKNEVEAISDKVICPTNAETYEEDPVGFYAKAKNEEILVSEDNSNGYRGNSRKYYISAIAKKPGLFYVKQGVLYIESYENQSNSEFMERYGDIAGVNNSGAGNHTTITGIENMGSGGSTGGGASGGGSSGSGGGGK